MRTRSTLALVSLVLLGGLGATYSNHAESKPPDANAKARLDVARQGYETVQELVARGRLIEETDRLAIWSRRIMDAQRDSGGDVVAAAQEHLERMKAYASRAEAQYKAAQASYSAVLDGRFQVLEAEALLAKAQAR